MTLNWLQYQLQTYPVHEARKHGEEPKKRNCHVNAEKHVKYQKNKKTKKNKKKVKREKNTDSVNWKSRNVPLAVISRRSIKLRQTFMAGLYFSCYVFLSNKSFFSD